MRTFSLCALCLLLPLAASAQQVQLRGLMGESAVLEIDGRQRLLRPGQKSPEGVQLLAVDARSARVKIGDVEQQLALGGSVAASYQQTERAEVRLAADGQGHYSTNAWVNGRSVSVMVDTGATSIAFNYPTARRLGLNLERAQPIRVATANGITQAYRVTLDSVTIGGIKLHNVDATVHADDFPHITLLGNSFLSRVDMEQQGGMLILRARN